YSGAQRRMRQWRGASPSDPDRRKAHRAAAHSRPGTAACCGIDCQAAALTPCSRTVRTLARHSQPRIARTHRADARQHAPMKAVFFDIDSQLDFVYPSGALYVPGAEHVIPAIARLNRYAAAHGIPVVSTVDAHTENDPEFQVWPHHCVAGTLGQRKAESTLLEKRVVVPNRDCELAIAGAQQIVVDKQTAHVFMAPNLQRLLEPLGA